MRKIKETLRLKHECGLKQRAISRALGVAPSTVSDYLKRAAAAGLSWPLPDGLDDDGLDRLLFVPADRSNGESIPVPDWRSVRQELSKKGVTRQLVWQEYMELHPDGYSYSRFCDLYREWSRELHPTMRLEHKAGERAFIDYPGPKMSYIAPDTGEVREASLFVAVLGASSYTFCDAHPPEDLENWITGHVSAFSYWGGVPQILVPDNLKAAVTHPCRYEPDLNPTYHELAMHYGVAVIPARVRKPRDKAKAETAVQMVQLLVIDDWLRDPVTPSQARDLVEILDDRYNRRSTLVATQVPVSEWHAKLGDADLADAVLDRLVHNAYRLQMNGVPYCTYRVDVEGLAQD